MRHMQNAQGSVTQFNPPVSLTKEQYWARVTSTRFSKGESVVVGPFKTDSERARFKFRLNNRLDGINSELGVALTANRLDIEFEPFESVSKPTGVRGTAMPNIESCIKGLYWSNPKNMDPSTFRSED